MKFKYMYTAKVYSNTLIQHFEKCIPMVAKCVHVQVRGMCSYSYISHSGLKGVPDSDRIRTCEHEVFSMQPCE